MATAIEIRKATGSGRCQAEGGCKFRAAIWLRILLGPEDLPRMTTDRQLELCNAHARWYCEKARSYVWKFVDLRKRE